MNLERARDTVARIESSVSGQIGRLPSNPEIRETAAFLHKHLKEDLVQGSVAELASRSPLVINAELAQGLRSAVSRLDMRMAKDASLREDLAYVPNQIASEVRDKNIAMSLGLLLYGGLGFWFDDIYVPGKRTAGVHFHGTPMLIILAAMACAVANLLTVVIDHYDHRNNEQVYRAAAKVTQALGVALFFLAVVLDLFVFKKATQ
jgi:hypothetical protein